MPIPPANPPAPRHCEVSWAGETLWLLPGRALYWPARQVMWVADVHLGKAATYRALGQPVPAGTTAGNLDRLDALMATHPVRQLVFLGDLLHAAQAHNPPLLAAVGAWRERHAQVACTLVRGNHDSRAGDPPPQLAIDVVDEPWLLGPFACCHHPQAHATHFVLAGHQHPACTLQGRGHDRVRLPCFTLRHAGTGLAVLPAFGEFTGGFHVAAEPGLSLFAVGGDAVWALPSPAKMPLPPTIVR